MGKKYKYKLYKDNEYQGEFTKYEIMEIAKLSPSTFTKYVSSDNTYNGFKFCEADGENKTENCDKASQVLLTEWDKVRFKLNPNAIGHEKYFRERKSNG